MDPNLTSISHYKRTGGEFTLSTVESDGKKSSKLAITCISI